MSSQEHVLALPIGTQIGQFRIESILGYGGFGIVYKAQHTTANMVVAIKEFLPNGLVTREGSTIRPLSEQDNLNYQTGLAAFLNEANQLLAFKQHPNIVTCTDFIPLNNTAYLVMDFVEGHEFQDFINKFQLEGNPLTEDEIMGVVIPVLKGLKYIHQHDVVHRDIKPSNIFIRNQGGQPLLIDFGAAKQQFTSSEKSEFQARTAGYAPLEQTSSIGKLGPWTDLHAVGAMMWRIIRNENPILVEDRNYSVMYSDGIDPMITALHEVADKYSAHFIAAIEKALALNHKDRFQDADEFISALTTPIEGEAVKTAKQEGPVIDRITELAEDPNFDDIVLPKIGLKTADVPGFPAKEIVQGTEHGSDTISVKPSSNRIIYAFVALIVITGLGFAYYLNSDNTSSEPISLVNLKPEPETIVGTLDSINAKLESIEVNSESMLYEQNLIDIYKQTCDLSTDSDCATFIKDAEARIAISKNTEIKLLQDAREETYDLMIDYEKYPDYISDLNQKKVNRERASNRNEKATRIENIGVVVTSATKRITEQERREYIASQIKAN